jgi:hypothetical protein
LSDPTDGLSYLAGLGQAPAPAPAPWRPDSPQTCILPWGHSHNCHLYLCLNASRWGSFPTSGIPRQSLNMGPVQIWRLSFRCCSAVGDRRQTWPPCR